MGNVQTNYDNVRVPEEHVIGKVNEGLEVARGVFETKWIHWASFLGAMQRLYDHMRDYAKQRVQGGKPIIQHPNVAYVLGEAAVDIEALRALIYKTARITDGYHDAGKRVDDLFWCEAVYNLWKRSGWRLCEIATDIYGGLSGSADMPLEAYVRCLVSLRAGGATTMINAIKCSMEYNKHPLAMQTEY
jgi:alkylation response protein AidB-like acyl-CoA dehydrogenase